jgi:RNA polymerase sigma-70 factor (ECF subfamily)
LYSAYGSAVFTFARRRMAAIDAEDVVAEVFLIAWRRREQIPERPLPWLLGVARRVIANRQRSQRRAEALIDRLGREALVADDGRRSEDIDAGALIALGSLSQRDQEVLLLAAWEGLTRTELAVALSISPQAAAVRLFRAKRRFARALREREPGRGSVSERAESLEVS